VSKPDPERNGLGPLPLWINGPAPILKDATALREDDLPSAAAKMTRALKLVVRFPDDFDPNSITGRVSLSTTVDHPGQLLDAISAAYGLRWVIGPKANEVTLMEPRKYRKSPEALRQAVANGLPEELQSIALAPDNDRLQYVEQPLRELEAKSAAQIEALTGPKLVRLDALPPEYSRPAFQFLNSLSALGVVARSNQCARELATNRGSFFHYAKNSSGVFQFSFKVEQRWITCDPQ
jgi:hypothetical protein